MNNNKNEMVRMYETMLSLPSMDETVKFNQGIPRKQVLLLALLIESGLKSGSPEVGNMLAAMPEGTATELTKLSEDYLQKAGLTELNAKLKTFNSGINGKECIRLGRDPLQPNRPGRIQLGNRGYSDRSICGGIGLQGMGKKGERDILLFYIS